MASEELAALHDLLLERDDTDLRGSLRHSYLCISTREKRIEKMKKRFYILAILSLIIVLVIIAIYVYEKPKGPALLGESYKSEKTDRLFQKMGIARMAPTAIPFDIGLQDLNGRTVKFSDFKGKIVFLNFWATWCPPCRIEMPSMEKLHNKLKNRDFVMLAVDLQEPATVVKEFFKEYNLSFTALLDSDGKVGTLFGVTSIPTTLILDKEGKIIGGALGAREWDSRESFALFEHLLNQAVAPIANPSMGPP